MRHKKIKSIEQYNKYCKRHEKLIFMTTMEILKRLMY